MENIFQVYRVKRDENGRHLRTKPTLFSALSLEGTEGIFKLPEDGLKVEELEQI